MKIYTPRKQATVMIPKAPCPNCGSEKPKRRTKVK